MRKVAAALHGALVLWFPRGQPKICKAAWSVLPMPCTQWKHLTGEGSFIRAHKNTKCNLIFSIGKYDNFSTGKLLQEPLNEWNNHV